MPVLGKCTLKYLSIKGYDVCNLSSYGPNTHMRGRERGRGEERQRQREREEGREGASEWEDIHTNYKAKGVKCEQ